MYYHVDEDLNQLLQVLHLKEEMAFPHLFVSIQAF